MFPSPLLPPCHIVWLLHIISERSASHTALYSQGIVLWEALAQPQGSAASAMVWHGLQRAPSSQQQPKSSCKLQFENQPSVFSPHLEDVGSTWHWVVDAIDGEDNRGQGIEHRT